MDLQMPVMDGLEAVQRFRSYYRDQSSNQSKSSLIIGLSANSDDETVQQAFNAGINDFLAKPFKIDTFFQKLNKLNYQFKNNLEIEAAKPSEKNI